MGKQLDKLIRKILQNPKNVSFEELDALLDGFGFERRQPKSGSSHYIYKKRGFELLISVPYKRPHIKEAYVKNIIRLLKLEDWLERNN